jgi:two-component system NtrC family response regulator
MVEKIAPNDVTTLIVGESGTGKELLARALHELNARHDQKFIAINCAAIPESLLESELFGHEKGAFTGAIKKTVGKIESANGGTLFLDEIGDLSMPLQAKLLRFLQERVIERVGGREEIPIDVRIVCATHQDLAKKMRTGEYREDLYYRISEVTLEVPPLRDRDGDALVLARSLLNELAAANNPAVQSFSEAAEQAIAAYSWPGNVREMENKIKSAVIMADGIQLTAESLNIHAQATVQHSLNLRELREHGDRHAVEQAFALAEGNTSKVAELLGVSRPTLYDLMKKLKIRL